MTVVPRPRAPERERLAALHEYRLLDAPAGDELDAVVRVAALVAGVPTATLNLIDEHRQCQLTTVGFEGADSARSDSMCAIRFETGRFVHVRDAACDPTYAPNPWVTGRLGAVRFYASAPLVTPQGHALGTLCVFDTEPRELTDEQVARLQDLAMIVLALFERRRQGRVNAELADEAERRQRFTDAVLETVDVGIVAADPAGHLTLFNRAARDWHGLDADPDLDPAEHGDRYALYQADGLTPMPPDRIPLARALREGSVTGAEVVLKPAGRPPRHVVTSGRALLAHGGAPLGAVAVMSDVTADRAQRRALEEAHARLTERGEQLVATVAELERSNAELAGFAGVVSHDLAAPLGVVRGYLELLDDLHGAQLPEQARTWVATATEAVTRMRQLIDALLTYAQAGHAPVHRQSTELRLVLDHVLIDLRASIKEAAAGVDVGPDLPTVACDATLIRQVLQNLVANALRYRHPTRRCRVAVTAGVTPDGVVVAVTDNGIGIPPEHRDRVFDMFTQVDPAARRGHGIGLSTCHRIIERHGGRIWADEAPGGGTTVRFTLPGPPRARLVTPPRADAES